MSDKISPGVSATLSNGLVVWFWVGLSLLVSVTSEGNDVMWFIKGLAVRLLLLGVFACFICILFRSVYCSGYNFNLFMSRCGILKLGSDGLYLCSYRHLRICFSSLAGWL